jgi:hypothetical protein
VVIRRSARHEPCVISGTGTGAKKRCGPESPQEEGGGMMSYTRSLCARLSLAISN